MDCATPSPCTTQREAGCLDSITLMASIIWDHAFGNRTPSMTIGIEAVTILGDPMFSRAPFNFSRIFSRRCGAYWPSMELTTGLLAKVKPLEGESHENTELA